MAKVISMELQQELRSMILMLLLLLLDVLAAMLSVQLCLLYQKERMHLKLLMLTQTKLSKTTISIKGELSMDGVLRWLLPGVLAMPIKLAKCGEDLPMVFFACHHPILTLSSERSHSSELIHT